MTMSPKSTGGVFEETKEVYGKPEKSNRMSHSFTLYLKLVHT